MYARVNTFEGSPNRLGPALRHIHDQTLPQLQQQAGFDGILVLVDRQTSKMVALVLWEDEKAMRDSEEAAKHLRSQAARAGDQMLTRVERYEVALFEVPR